MKSFILFLLFPVIIFAQDFNYVVPNPSLEYSTNYFLGWDGTDMYATNPPPVVIEASTLKLRKFSSPLLPPALPAITNYINTYRASICIKTYIEVVRDCQTNQILIKSQPIN